MRGERFQLAVVGCRLPDPVCASSLSACMWPCGVFAMGARNHFACMHACTQRGLHVYEEPLRKHVCVSASCMRADFLRLHALCCWSAWESFSHACMHGCMQCDSLQICVLCLLGASTYCGARSKRICITARAGTVRALHLYESEELLQKKGAPRSTDEGEVLWRQRVSGRWHYPPKAGGGA